ncbi:MAG: hypothetical protein VX938_11945 [Myxococcota bacterium]|nr:hypothetical protein [Myxococcota bacterium]MEE2780294.1 hypothetical protein [Myxococcota bacterium]
MSSHFLSLLSVLGLIASAAGCAPEAPRAVESPFSPPVGVEMGASGDVPALTLAISLSKGAALESVVEPLTTAVHSGLRACPMYVEAATSGDLERLNLSFTQGALMMAPAAVETDGTRCMAEQIGGVKLSTPKELKLKARVQILIKKPEAQKP